MLLFANCILSSNKLRNIYKILDDMKYALISGASSGLAKEVINLIEDDYFFALDINPELSLELEQYSTFILIITTTTFKNI